jgi:membrane peptidoglycan carboxypeptidase
VSSPIPLLREIVDRVRSGGARTLSTVVGVGVVLFALVAVGLYSLTDSRAVALEQWIPASTEDADTPLRSTVLAADGSVLATFGTQDRQPVTLDEVAPVMRNALLAAEDNRFYDHGAVDPVGLLRALATNIAAGHVKEGGSTLTQQYVKQVQVTTAQNSEQAQAATETTLSRKIREVGTALAVENDMSKNEIFSRYLNLVYFGNGAYGIQVAAQRYFSVDAKDLTLPQAALLAGLVRSPTYYDPLQHPQQALDRRSVVLDRMVSTGRISAAEAQAAKAEPLGLRPSEPQLGCVHAAAPFYCQYVVSEIRRMDSLGRTPEQRMHELLTGGLTIRTTLDPQVQQAAQAAVDHNIGRGNEIAAAIVMTEPGTGNVRAIALNRAYGEDERKHETTVNYALDKDQGGSAGFQAGSNFKPFVAAAALDKGIEASRRFVGSRDVTVNGFDNCATGKAFPPYHVGNYQGESYGSLDMAEATAMSVNTYFAQLEEQVGVCAPPKLAESMGVKRADGKDLSRVPSFVLGVDEVSPLRMAEAYATFAADGKHCASRAVTDITDADGDHLNVPGQDCTQVLGKRVARQVTELLEGVINGPEDHRTGKHMSLGERPAAGKTGTTNDATAVWFTGFTKQLAASVWAGYPSGSKPLKNVTIRGTRYKTLFGGALPGPIWHDAMLKATKGEKIRRLVLPVPDCEAKKVPADAQERCAADPKVTKKKAREAKHERQTARWLSWRGPGPAARER